MSELKAHLFVPYSELQEGDELTDAFTIAKSYYLKSEADKVIDEKDKEIAELKAENQSLKDTIGGTNIAYKQCYDEYTQCDKELRHHKYKRCMAMAKWCDAEQTYSSFAIYITEHPKSRWANKSVGAGNWIAFWKNREQRWLKLADEFKEAK